MWRPRPPCYAPSLSFSFELALQLRFLLPHPPFLAIIPFRTPIAKCFPSFRHRCCRRRLRRRLRRRRRCFRRRLWTSSESGPQLLNPKRADAACRMASVRPLPLPPPFIPPSLPPSLRQTVRQHSHLPLPNTNDAVWREGEGGRETGVGRGRVERAAYYAQNGRRCVRLYYKGRE